LSRTIFPSIPWRLVALARLLDRLAKKIRCSRLTKEIKLTPIDVPSFIAFI
jgi:hypothetical protein